MRKIKEFTEHHHHPHQKTIDKTPTIMKLCIIVKVRKGINLTIQKTFKKRNMFPTNRHMWTCQPCSLRLLIGEKLKESVRKNQCLM